MWFPSLGGTNTAAFSTTAGSQQVISSQRIPQTSTTAGSSPHVKAALNRRIKGAQEQLRSKTSYNARQI